MDQVFISYRREGGDISAKLICESLKNRGFTVFYDFDSLSGGYFDERILDAIRGCNDFVLVLPPNSLDRCVNPDDWVRQEIACAMKYKKNIVPVMLPGFTFPAVLPAEIENVSRFNAVHFVMAYFEGVMDTIEDRLTSRRANISPAAMPVREKASENLTFVFDEKLEGYAVKMGKCTDAEIVIPRTYQGKAVVAVAENGFRECSAITKVVIPDTVSHIGESAFYKCTLLESVTLPDRLAEIGKWAFYKCVGLTSITIPRNVRKIGLRAFADCETLKQFVVEEGNNFFCNLGNHLYTKDLKKLINYAGGCQETAYEVPEGVVEIDDCAFSLCRNLKYIKLPESVRRIQKFAFIDCSSLEEVVLPSRLDSLGSSSFKRCVSLTNVEVPYGLTSIGDDTFRDCSALTKAVLPETLKSIGEGVFNGCAALEEMELPSRLTEIGKWAFYECATLTSMTIPKNVDDIGARAFTRCAALKKFRVSADNEDYCAVGNHLYTKDMKKLVSFACGSKESTYTVPDGVVDIEECAFSACRSLTHIKLPESVRFIRDFAFIDCENLVEIQLPKQATLLADFAFKSCSSLVSVKVPDGVPQIGEDTFRNCSALKKIVLPDSIKSIGEGAFNGCASLESVTIPGQVTELGKWAFYGCTSLTSITIPKSVKSIGNRALANCKSLTDFSVSFWNKDYRDRRNHLYTKDMKTLVNYAIGSRATEFVIPDGVEIIGDSSFYDCAYLQNVTIPKTVKRLEDFAFDKCTKLGRIQFCGTVEMWKQVSRGSNSLRKVETKLIECTDGTVKI